MATGHFHKTSADVGAPPLRNVAGDTIAVLDFLLDVAAGTFWQKVFTGLNKAAYRATTGQRYFLQVIDGTTTATVRMFATMTDVDTGTGITPDATQRASPSYYLLKTTATTVAREWRAAGDSRYFALLVSADATTPQSVVPLCFGEATPTDASDSYNSMIFASNNTSGVNASTDGPMFGVTADQVVTSPRLYWARTIDGLTASSDGAIQPLLPTGAAAGGAIAKAAVPAINAIRAWDYHRTGSLANGHVRGTLPYVYAAPYNYDAAVLAQGATLPIGASTFSAHCGNSNGAYALLRTSNDEPGRV